MRASPSILTSMLKFDKFSLQSAMEMRTSRIIRRRRSEDSHTALTHSTLTLPRTLLQPRMLHIFLLKINANNFVVQVC